MKKSVIIAGLAMSWLTAAAQTDSGGISLKDIEGFRASFAATPGTKALHNAIANNPINSLALNHENLNNLDTHFSHRVPSKGITNQRSSGRCWLFTGLNVLRAQAMTEHNLPQLELSQSYNFFWDQLEKSNLFLQGVIDTASKPFEDRTVDWLFSNPLSDGGQYTGIADNLMKYGVVPIEVMGETESSKSTATMRRLLSLRLREDGLELRKLAAEGRDSNALETRKKEMLSQIYRMLALNLGEPPTEFTWTRRDSDGQIVDTKTYTPQSFYKTFIGNDLKKDYVMLMNDPTREYYKLYEIEYDRHAYDGANWQFINLPIEDIKAAAIESLKNNRMMYSSWDVGKFLNREDNVARLDNFDYESLFGISFGMNKADRIRTGDSGSTHAMTLVAVDIDSNGKPVKWMVENSWGPGANDGHIIMYDDWVDEYMFRLVVNKEYLPAETLKILNQKPIMLPAWDPMF